MMQVFLEFPFVFRFTFLSQNKGREMKGICEQEKKEVVVNGNQFLFLFFPEIENGCGKTKRKDTRRIEKLSTWVDSQ